jgi:salicylate synthase/phospho-2-dehydro-3-deoxyheptonate aldolase
VLNGTDDRLLVIVGPCSIHEQEAAVEYAGRLSELADTLSDDLLVVMRTYFEKPRTSVGWPGLALSPDLHGPPDPERGFRLARQLMAEITDMGVPVAVEWLTPVAPAYFEDLVAWGSIGARSVENQTYRQMASSLAMPIGMKNRTDGAVHPAVDAVRAAARRQAFLGIAPDGSAALTRTAGNPDCHVVLRGGANGPNYHSSAVRHAQGLLRAAGLSERLVIDASHGNCNKDHERQRAVALDLGQQVGAGSEVIRGVMLESFLVAGRQEAAADRPLERGQSVTDPCMSWPVTAEVLAELAAATGNRRGRRHVGSRAEDLLPEREPEAASAGNAQAASAIALVQSGIFDTYMVYEREGVWTVAGGSQASITLDANRIRLCHQGEERSWTWRSRPLGGVGDVLAELPIPEWTAYGWIAFEAAHLIAGRPELAGDGELAHLIVPQAEVRIDSAGATITCADGALHARIRDLLANVPPGARPPKTTLDINLNDDGYEDAAADAVREIEEGWLQKVVLSRIVPVDTAIDFPRTYLLGRAANTPARSFLLDIGGRRATGFCPETVLEASAGGIVSTQPLAGTRSFGNGEDQDARLRAELLNDVKEIYEHAISLKLAHDELAQVCKPDSMTVNDLMSVKPRGSVQHLASRVRGELDEDKSAWDALEAVFPAVTSSGIPKAAACAYIANHERWPRGLYSGAVVAASHDGALDAALVLRAVFEENGRRWLRAGAGIVATSLPEREYEETREKFSSVAPYLVPGSESDPE